jgi:type VI secretion system protein ImpK
MSVFESIRSDGKRYRAWISSRVNDLSKKAFKKKYNQALFDNQRIAPEFQTDSLPVNDVEVLVLRRRLIDLFLPVMAYVQEFSLAPAGSALSLENRLSEMIGDARSQAVNDDFSVDEFNEALFPVLAWVDERVSLLHPWEGAHAWQDHLLQRLYFRTSLAGVEFFERLEDIDEDQSSVREVFLFCLCMGFLGKYNNEPAESDLAYLRVKHYRILQSKGYIAQFSSDTPLCSFAYPREPLPAAFEARWKRWVNPMAIAIILLPLILFAMLVLTLDFRLGESVDAFRRATQL